MATYDKLNSNWREVGKTFRCPVCAHDSWCVYTSQVVLCMRTAGGKRKTFRDGQVGYLYKLNGEYPAPPPAKEKIERPAPDMGRLNNQWRSETPAERLEALSKSLSLPGSSLVALETAYAKERGAYAFPMRDGSMRIVGIRLRTESGLKFAVTG